MHRLSRPTALKIAAGIAFLLNLFLVRENLPSVAMGTEAMNAAPDAPPYIFVISGLIVAVIGVVGALGLWQQQRWGVLLTLLVSTVSALLYLPGIIFAPTGKVLYVCIVGLFVAIIIFCLWRERKPAKI